MALPSFNVLSICTGYGGIDLGLSLAIPSSRTVCYVEIEAYACEVLAQRMRGGAWMTRLFGRMPEPSTARRGVAWWIASLRAIRANRGPLPESGPELMTLGIFGQLSFASLKSAGHHRSSSRTSQITLFSDLQTSEQIYNNLVTELKLAYLARQRLAHRTEESDSSRWPTMTVFGNNNRTGCSETSGDGLATIARDWATPRASMTTGPFVHEKSGQDLQTQVSYWPTPMTPSGGRVNTPEEVARKGTTEKGKRTISLESVTKYWPTPIVFDPGDAGDLDYRQRHREAVRAKHGGGVTPSLGETARTWATPIASEAKHGSPNQKYSDGQPGLSAQAITMWNTPTAQDHKGASPAATVRINSGTGLTRDQRLREQAVANCPPSHRGLATDLPGNEFSKATRRLNPLFVEYLMGLPRGWTSCGPLEMASFQSWRRTHFALLQICLRKPNE